MVFVLAFVFVLVNEQAAKKTLEFFEEAKFPFPLSPASKAPFPNKLKKLVDL